MAWRPSQTRPQEVLDLEELLSELIAEARMLRFHLGSRLVSISSMTDLRETLAFLSVRSDAGV